MNIILKKEIIVYIISIMSVIVLSVNAFANDNKTNDNKQNFKSYTDDVILRPFFKFSSLELTIGNRKSREDNDKSREIKYKPNSKINIGFGFSWKEWGGSLGASVIPIPGREADKYGKTDSLDFQFFYYFRKFHFDLYFQQYKGYYISDENYTGSDGIRSDLEIINVGLNVIYVFSDKFSFRSSFSQTERQIKSGGSWITMSSYNYFRINSKDSLILPENESYFGKDAGYKGGSYSSISLLGGYSYSYIFCKRWYATVAVLIGGGGMYQAYTVSEGGMEAYSICSRYNNRIAFGYNGEKYFAGILSVIDIQSTEPFLGLYKDNSESIIITRMSVHGELFAGIRF